jgi:hypothetical protein
MNKRRSNVLAVLALARPARLDAGAGPGIRWPAVSQFTEAASANQFTDAAEEAAELADDGPARELDSGQPGGRDRRRRRSSRWRRPLVPVKLLGALTSAAVTAVVIVIAVIIGTVVFRTPHGQPTGAPSSPVYGRPPLFRSLPLGPHWHGHLAYAVSHGVVYLAGTATVDHQGSPSGGYGSVTTLPSLARPSGPLDVAVAASTGSGAVQIGADGQINVIRQQAGVTWVSLGGVSFPAGSR